MNIDALLMSENNNWFTPARYIEAARVLMGGIDLDPASCEQANHVVKATRYYTEQENGLMQPWYGCVWLNPPYGRTNGKSNQDVWSSKLLSEYAIGNVEEAVLLVTVATETAWFQRMLAYHPVCLTNHRIKFVRGVPGSNGGPVHGSAFFYLGTSEQKFHALFSQFGIVVKPPSVPVAAVNLELWGMR